MEAEPTQPQLTRRAVAVTRTTTEELERLRSLWSSKPIFETGLRVLAELEDCQVALHHGVTVRELLRRSMECLGGVGASSVEALLGEYEELLKEEALMETKAVHIDDWIDDPTQDPYARWMFLYFRLPAFQLLAFRQFMAEHKLFCTYEGVRYRVTGASRLGDVWLISDFSKDIGYEHRVAVDECSGWGKEP